VITPQDWQEIENGIARSPGHCHRTGANTVGQRPEHRFEQNLGANNTPRASNDACWAWV
jgi:hypothetical protein